LTLQGAIERVKVSDATAYGSNGRFTAIPVVIFDYINSACCRIAFLLAILRTRRAIDIRVAARSLNLLHSGDVTFELSVTPVPTGKLADKILRTVDAFDY
jgi:hypothetical protein